MQNYGWVCVAVCSILCKAHLYDDGRLSKDKKYCECITKVEFSEIPPLKINHVKDKPEIKEPYE